MSKTRRYSEGEVRKRRKDYLRFCLSKREYFDFCKMAIYEYKVCQRQRGYSSHGEVAKFRRTIERDNKFFLTRIAVSVTNQCSLKCRDCNNLMPYCKDRYFVDVQEQIQDIKRLLQCSDGIVNAEVIGGEPFVYKQLPELLSYLCEEPNVIFVEVTTNGTIIPSDEVLPYLKNSKVCVLISDYGEVNEERAGKTYQYLLQNGVCVQNLKNRRWIYPGGLHNRKKAKWQLKYEYFHCFARKSCRTLYKGNLYVCGRAPILDELGLLSDKSSFLNIRELSQKSHMGQAQLRRFFKNSYAQACNFCDCSSDNSYWIESGVQIKKKVKSNGKNRIINCSSDKE